MHSDLDRDWCEVNEVKRLAYSSSHLPISLSIYPSIVTINYKTTVSESLGQMNGHDVSPHTIGIIATNRSCRRLEIGFSGARVPWPRAHRALGVSLFPFFF